MILMVKHHVKDYETWKRLFDEHQAVREQHGATGHLLYRGAEDPNRITILNQFPSAQHAREFMEDPTLKEVMARAGVDSEPEVTMWDEAEGREYKARRAA